MRVRRTLSRFSLVALALVVAAAGGLLPFAIHAANSGRDGRLQLEAARDALRQGDTAAADTALKAAAAEFGDLQRTLRVGPLRAAERVPLLAHNVRTARVLASAGTASVRAAVLAREGISVPLGGGAGDLAALRRARGALEGALPVLNAAASDVKRTPQSGLLPQLARARSDGHRSLEGASRDLTRTLEVLRAAPAMLGDAGPRRYLLLFATPAEARGTGGLFGQFAIILADRGRLSIERQGRPIDDLPAPSGVTAPPWLRDTFGRLDAAIDWRQLNITTDFPTAARAAAAAVPNIDGVLQVDPPAVAAVLSSTGPVTVPGWDEPIGADNVVSVVSHQTYLKFGDDRGPRAVVLNNLIAATFGLAQSSPSAATLSGLGDVASRGHIQIWLSRPAEQSLVERGGIAGNVARTAGSGDVFGLVTQNWSGTKADWFLRRRVRVRIALDPATGRASGAMTATLHNDSPTEGMPTYVIGPSSRGHRKGVNRQMVTLLRPPGDELESFSANRNPLDVVSGFDERLRASYGFVNIDPGGSQTLRSTWSRAGAVQAKRYRLRVLRQPSLRDDDVYDVQIQVPRGWRADGRTSFRGAMTTDEAFDIKLRETTRGKFVRIMILTPFRAMQRVLQPN